MATLVESFREIGNDDLRVVATLESTDYEIEYIRSDLEEAYSDVDLDEAHRNLIANQVSSADFSEVGAFGDLDAQVLFFEDIVVFLFPTSRYSAVFVSYERTDTDGSIPVRDVIATATDHPEIPGDQ